MFVFCLFFQTTLTSHSHRYRDRVTACTASTTPGGPTHGGPNLPGTMSPRKGPNMSVIVMQQPNSSAVIQNDTATANSTGKYRKVASSRLSWLVAHSRIFRLFIKGKFDAYVL